jgi:hypothetical protein
VGEMAASRDSALVHQGRSAVPAAAPVAGAEECSGQVRVGREVLNLEQRYLSI